MRRFLSELVVCSVFGVAAGYLLLALAVGWRP